MNNLAEHMTNQLEADVREYAQQLYNEQLAFIFKVPEEMTQTPCDFFGHTRYGRAILFECKMVNRPSLPLGKEPGLRPHQIRALDQAEKCGAISFVVWRRGDDTLVVPYLDIFSVTDRKSLPWVKPQGYWKTEMRGLLEGSRAFIGDLTPMVQKKG